MSNHEQNLNPESNSTFKNLDKIKKVLDLLKTNLEQASDEIPEQELQKIDANSDKYKEMIKKKYKVRTDWLTVIQGAIAVINVSFKAIFDTQHQFSQELKNKQQQIENLYKQLTDHSKTKKIQWSKGVKRTKADIDFESDIARQVIDITDYLIKKIES